MRFAPVAQRWPITPMKAMLARPEQDRCNRTMQRVDQRRLQEVPNGCDPAAKANIRALCSITCTRHGRADPIRHKMKERAAGHVTGFARMVRKHKACNPSPPLPSG